MCIAPSPIGGGAFAYTATAEKVKFESKLRAMGGHFSHYANRFPRKANAAEVNKLHISFPYKHHITVKITPQNHSVLA